MEESLCRSRYRWKDNTKNDLKDIYSEDVDWIRTLVGFCEHGNESSRFTSD
jgi:hypothetical protein